MRKSSYDQICRCTVMIKYALKKEKARNIGSLFIEVMDWIILMAEHRILILLKFEAPVCEPHF